MKSLKLTILVFITSLTLVSCSNNESDSNGGSCDTECTYSIASGENAATVLSSLNGTYNLTYHSAQPGSPYTDGTVAKFTIDNNELTVEINGECLTIKNPVLRGTNNFLFKDTCDKNITYNLSPNNDGSFNEINIEPLGQGWYGQFSE